DRARVCLKKKNKNKEPGAVAYTNLKLPTKRKEEISGVAVSVKKKKQTSVHTNRDVTPNIRL
ncbi:hypothetical protein, partial [Escherichia coli]|uniref:hypothetical protein n=1 Tax=Escherichia coli TaxID=562 RepID=UPI001BC8A8EA